MDAGPRTRPKIALDIQPESVGKPFVDRAEDAVIGEPAAIDDVEDSDVAGRAGLVTGGGIRHIELRFVRGEGEAVRLDEIGRHGIELARLGVEALDILGLLLRFRPRSEEHTAELPSHMRTSYAVFFLE